MTVIYYPNPALCKALTAHDIELEDYGPAYGESACLDLYNAGPDIIVWPLIPEDYSGYWENVDPGTKKADFKTLIPTGIHLALKPNQVALIQERGSITKTPLKVRAGVIDAGYSGEVFVNAVNLAPAEYRIPTNAKLPFQLLVTTCDNAFNPITLDTFNRLHQDSQRGAGKIGSSDKKGT